MAYLQYQNAHDEIDRQWQRQRDRLLILQKDGLRTEPNAAGAIVGGVSVAIIGSMFGVATHPAFCLLAIVVGMGVAAWGLKQVEQFRSAQRRYRMRKADLNVDDFRTTANQPQSFSGIDVDSGQPDFRAWREDR